MEDKIVDLSQQQLSQSSSNLTLAESVGDSGEQDEPEKSGKNVLLENRNELETMMKFSTEYSFATFWNWFLPTCLDCWSSPASTETIVAYGSRSFLFLADIFPDVDKSSNNDWKIQYRDLVNVFDFKVKSRNTDRFRSVNIFISTAVFEKTALMLSDKKCSSFSGEKSSPRIFLGTNDASAAVYDLQQRTTLLQDLTFNVIKLACCRNVSQRKIISGAWLRFVEAGPTVFYSLDTHIVCWSIEQNRVSILHDNGEPCGSPKSRLGSGQLQISCLASMPAECTSDKLEHKLAVGYMGGRICIFGFDPVTGHQRSLTVFSDNGHGDDICSLSFSTYSLPSISAAYKQSVLCSVSRNSILKVWSCSQLCEIAEYRINLPATGQSSSGKYSSSGFSGTTTATSNSNWFSAVFLPRSTVSKLNAYEIMVSSGSGEMLTVAIPAKELNSKLRISKTLKFNSPSSASSSSSSLHHSSIVFSIAVSHRQLLAISCSLDYRLLVWCLRTRTPATLLHSFSNGTFAIDCMARDKRIAIAFGNSIFVLDFALKHNDQSSDSDQSRNPMYEVQATHHNISIPNSKTNRFYEIRWNRQDSETQLGQLVLGTSTGDLFYYDLASKSFLYKSTKWKSTDSLKDISKIYKICWSVKFPVSARAGKQPQQQQSNLNLKSKPLLSTVAISLHQSGKIMVNYLRMPENHPQKPPESIDRFIEGIPSHQRRKQSAMDISDDQKFFLIGNDDGTVDVLRLIEEEEEEEIVEDVEIVEDKIGRSSAIYRHLFRFRAFTKPIISIQICNKTGWISVTALQCNWIHCYNLEVGLNPADSKRLNGIHGDGTKIVDLGDSQESASIDSGPPKSDDKFVVKSITIRRKLSGHEDRVCATCWSPFNQSPEAIAGTDPTEPSQSQSSICLLASGSYDSTCIVWDVHTSTALRCFFGHKSLVYTIKWCHFNPDFIFSGGEDNFHFWNWTKQPPFVPKLIEKISEKNFLVKIESVHLKLKQQKASSQSSSEIIEEEEELKEVEVKPKSSKSKSSSKSLTGISNANQSSNSVQTQTKALFPYSNQVENNSSKFDILNDIKLICRYLNGGAPDVGNAESNNDSLMNAIPEQKLDRILIYINSMKHTKQFLQLELDYHRKNACPEAFYMVSMFADPAEFIEKSIESNNCDLFMANIAAGLSYRLWQNCVRSCIRPDKSDGTTVPKIRSKSTYNTEMSVLLELYSLHDFQSAIDSLLRHNLYREALILANLNQASESFIANVMDRWGRQRLAQGNYEGAAKCLVACQKNSEAILILEQRRTLCNDTSSSSILKQYDEVIQLLKNSTTPITTTA